MSRTESWIFTSAAVCLAVGGGYAASRPKVGIAVLILVLATFLAVWTRGRPGRVTGLLVLAILVARQAQNLVPIGLASFVDEAAVGLAVGVGVLTCLTTNRSPRGFTGMRWLLIFLTLGVTSAVIRDVPLSVIASGTLLPAKGGLLAWGIAQMSWTKDEVTTLVRFGTRFTWFIMVGVVVNLLTPGAWAERFATGGGVSSRYGIAPPLSFFAHPAELAGYMALVAAAAAAAGASGLTRRYRLIMIVALLTSASTLRRKTVIGLTAVLPFIFSRTRKAGALLWTTLLFGTGALFGLKEIRAAGASAAQEYLANPGDVARIVLLRGSVDISREYFPFGAGFGRYGSFTAAANYSPEYYQRGFTSVPGLGATEQTGSFLNDSQWPAILGEAGMIGATAFALMLFTFYRAFRRQFRNEAQQGWRQTLGLVGMGWVLVLLIESVGNPVFYAPPLYAPLFALVGLVSALTAVDVPETDDCEPDDCYPSEPAAPRRQRQE